MVAFAPQLEKRWQPGIAIRISAVFHLACLAYAALRPASWPWIILALAANHGLIALIGLVPKTRLLGPNMLRLPEGASRRGEIALTFDDGPDPHITPLVLDLLDRHHAKASFFCVGSKVSAHPDVVREIVRRGHSVENHSMHHSKFFGFLGFRRLRTELQSAQDAIATVTGRAPEFFRSPMGIRNPFVDPVVTRLGLTYITWTRRGFDTVSRQPHAVLARLLRGLAAGDVLLLHDRQARAGKPPVLEVLPALLETVSAAGLKAVSLPMAMR